MSYKAVLWVRSLRLDKSAKMVLGALAQRAGDDNSCFPSHQTLVADTGASLDTIQRALHQLRTSGLIVQTLRYDSRGKRTSNRYTLQVGANPHSAAKLGTSLRNVRSTKPQCAGDRYTESNTEDKSKSALCPTSKIPAEEEWTRADRTEISHPAPIVDVPGSEVFSGKNLTVTAPQHDRWQRMFPGRDLLPWYAIADAECTEKLKFNDAAIAHAQKKFGFMASDKPLSRQDASDAWFRGQPGYMGRG